MNFLIKIENDPLFYTGIIGLINQAVKECNSRPSVINTEFSAENIRNADFIFMTVCAGEYFLCFKDLLKKKKSAGTFIFVGSETLPEKSSLPACIKNAHIFSQKVSPDTLYENIVKAIRNHCARKESIRAATLDNYTCINCNYRTLSFTQEKIAYGLSNCLSISDIAGRIGITYKTAVSHKKNIMSKFNLNNKLELYEFVTRYRRNKD